MKKAQHSSQVHNPSYHTTLCCTIWSQRDPLRFYVCTDIDLSSLCHAINAAEPVDMTSIESFYATFARYGLRRGCVVPTYGLAEHTVFVCSGGRQVLRVAKTDLESGTVSVLTSSDHETYAANSRSEEAKGGAEGSVLVGCGYPGQGQGVDLIIVSPESTSALPDDQVHPCAHVEYVW